MKLPYQVRVSERHFLNLPGHHAGAFVHVFIEDTSERALEAHRYRDGGLWNPSPRLILEIADCSHRIELEFDVSEASERQNSFHKIDTLIESLTKFREGLVAEARLYKDRDQEICEARDERDLGSSAVKVKAL